MRQVVIKKDPNIEIVDVSEVVDSRGLVVKHGNGMAGIVLQKDNNFYSIQWSNGTESSVFDSIKQMVKYYSNFEFFQL